MIFGKSKARTAEDILKDIDELSEEEREKLKSALNGASTAPAAETDTQPESPPETGESETEEPAPETTEESDEERAEESTEENAETPEQTEEPETVQAEETEQAPAAEPEVKNDYAEAIAALVSRMDAMESTLSGLQNAKAEAEDKEKNQDFGMNPSAPKKGEEDNERMSAVIRGYAGRNAKDYI